MVLVYFVPRVLIAMFGICLVTGQLRGKLRDRVDYLEYRVNKETTQTRDDVYELRQLIYSLNASQDTSVDGDDNNSETCSADITNIEQKLEHLAESQETTRGQFARGFYAEKRLYREGAAAQEKRMETHRELIDETKSALKDINRKVAQVEAERKATNDETATAKSAMKDTNRKVAQLEAERKATNDEMTTAKSAMKDINRKVARLEAERKATNDEMTTAKSAMKDINRKVAQLEAERKATKDEMATAIPEITAKPADVQEEIWSTKQAANTRTRQCPNGWISWETSCYLQTNANKDWTTARETCSEMGAHLAQAETVEEMRYLLPLLSDATWLGGGDRTIEGVWTWAEGGAVITYLPWRSGQPNNQGGNQHCLDTWDHQLNDDDCSELISFVCEKHA